MEPEAVACLPGLDGRLVLGKALRPVPFVKEACIGLYADGLFGDSVF